MSERLVNVFCEMVKIDSESGNEQAFLSYLSTLFSRDLGAECHFDGFGNLIARAPAKNCVGKPTILLSAHADTVKPGQGIEPVLEDGVIRSKGDTVLGADDKAGIAEIYEALMSAHRHPETEVVITRQEEVGLVGARNLDVSGLKAKIGFVMDGDMPNALIIGGPTYMAIDVEITGKAAHAGMEPEKGISAIKAASYAIAMLKDGWLDKESTFNIGMIEGGRIRNGVPEKATLKAECRSLNHDTCLTHSNLVKDVFETAARAIGAKAEVKLTILHRASRVSDDAPAVSLARRAIEQMGLTPNVQVICGGTDAAILNEKGIQSVVLGAGCRAEHSTDEHVLVADMEAIVGVLHRLFEAWCA